MNKPGVGDERGAGLAGGVLEGDFSLVDVPKGAGADAAGLDLLTDVLRTYFAPAFALAGSERLVRGQRANRVTHLLQLRVFHKI